MRKLTIILSLLFLSSFVLKNDSLNEVVEKIITYFSSQPIEKIYVHTDKPYYAQGDQLWYSVYVTEYQTNKLLGLSEILHVKLLNRKGAPVLYQKVPLQNGRANGVLSVPDTLKADYYKLKAYTSWSKNFNKSLAYSDFIKVVSANYKKEGIQLNEIKYDIQVEGGQFVANKLNKVALTLSIDSADFYLLNSSKDTLQQVKVRDNFGVIPLVPQPGDKLVLTLDGNAQKVIKLPNAQTEGTVLRVDERGDAFNLFIEHTEKFEGETISILVLNKANVVIATQKELQNSGVALRLNKGELPTGLSHVIILDKENKILNERLFNNSKEEPQLSVDVEPSYTARQEGLIKLPLASVDSANVSISIISGKHFSDNLHSQGFGMLKPKDGKFSLNQRLIAESMEDYDISEVLNQAKIEFDYPIEKNSSFSVQGAYNTEPDAPKFDYSAVSVIGDSSTRFYFARVEDNNLKFSIPSFYGDRMMFIKPYEVDEAVSAYPFNLAVQEKEESFDMEFDQSEVETNYAVQVRENNIIRRLFEIQYSKATSDLIETPIDFSILSTPDAVIKMEDYIVLPNMQAVASEILEGVKIKDKGDSTYEVRMRPYFKNGSRFGAYYDNQPLMFIDGTPINNAKYVAELSPVDVDEIKMTYGTFKLSGVKYEGILSISTVEGNYGLNNDVNQFAYKYPGFTVPKKFEIPQLKENYPDYRPTLFWSSSLKLIKDETNELAIPMPDASGDYYIIIKGLSSTGQLIEEEVRFKVKDNIN